jgi:peptide/nickel transport system substrate-binding protein
MDGLYEPATGMFPEFLPYAVQNQVTDLFRANQLLDSIGWKMGDDGYRYRDGERLTVKFHVRPTFGDWVSHVLAVQDQVKATGFFVDIVQNDDSTLNLDRSEWDATIIGNATISIWSGNAEVQLVRYHLSDSVQNYSGMADPQIDRLAKDLMAEFDEAKRYQMLRDVQDIMIESKAYLIVASFSRPSIVVNAAYRNMKVDNWRNWVNWQTAPQQ